MSNTLHVDRQKDVAALALTAERVSQRMVARIKAHRSTKGPTITLALDEYVQIGLCITSLTGVAKELHAHYDGGVPTRSEIIQLAMDLSVAGNALAKVTDGLTAIAQRFANAPREDEDGEDSGNG